MGCLICPCAVQAAIGPWLQGAGCTIRDQCDLEGSGISRRFVLRFKGDMDATLDSRIRHAFGALRDDRGTWRRFAVELPLGRSVPLFIGLDKNRRAQTRELAVKRVVRALSEHLGARLFGGRDSGVVSHQWEPLVSIVVGPVEVPRIRWNNAKLADMRLEKGPLDTLVNNLSLRPTVKWDGCWSALPGAICKAISGHPWKGGPTWGLALAPDLERHDGGICKDPLFAKVVADCEKLCGIQSIVPPVEKLWVATKCRQIAGRLARNHQLQRISNGKSQRATSVASTRIYSGRKRRSGRLRSNVHKLLQIGLLMSAVSLLNAVLRSGALDVVTHTLQERNCALGKHWAKIFQRDPPLHQALDNCTSLAPALEGALEGRRAQGGFDDCGPRSAGSERLDLDSMAIAGVHTFLDGFGIRPADLPHADVTEVASRLGRPAAVHPDAPLAARARDELVSCVLQLCPGRAGPWVTELSAEAVFDFHAEVDDAPGGHMPLLLASQDPATEGHDWGGRRRLAARAYRGLAALAATRLWGRLSAARQARLLAGGGLGAGAFWNGFLREGETALTDAAFVVMFRRRLLLNLLSAPVACAFRYSGAAGDERSGTCCGRPLDVAGLHALQCPVWAHRIRLHNETVRILAEWISSHGGYADQERCVPELYQQEAGGELREARLDLVVSWPGMPVPVWVDVTVRSADPSGPGARTIGHAAIGAERHKRERYGDAVVPFAVEAEGRLGPQAQRFVADMAAAARRVAVLPGEASGRLGSDFARKLSERLSGALTARMADLLLAAAEGAGVGPWLGARQLLA
ncbi:unnamed protein product, partial [Prorocentrum cordatum]